MAIFGSTSSSKLKKHSRHQSFSESLMDDSIEDAEATIHELLTTEFLDTSTSSFCCISSLFSTKNRDEAQRLIDAVTSLHSNMLRLVSVNPTSMKLVRAENLLKISMNHLSNEFYRILKSNRRYLDPESVSIRSRQRTNDEHTDAMTDLKMIADCMISSGYGKECFQIYKRIRKSIIVEALNNLDFERLDCELTEKSVRKWIRVTKKAVTTLFYGEKILSDHVFSSSSAKIRESSFVEIISDSALAMFTLPMAKSSRKSPEKIFLTLDIYQNITELLPKIDDIFDSNSTSSVRTQVNKTISNLKEAVISMLEEFESSIAKESSKSTISNGRIHQLTRYVMNYIVFLADYSDTLSDIIQESSSPLPEQDSSPSIGNRIAWLIFFLLCKIDAKSRIYNDVALTYLFLINNLNYVVVKVRTSNLKEVLSDGWLENHERKVKKYVGMFEKLVWGETMTTLFSEEEEVLSRFSDRFEEAYKRQAGWVVPDRDLRDEMKLSVAMMILPSYTEVYKRENVGFAPDDFGNYLSDLYFEAGGSGSVLSVRSSDSYGN